MASKKRAKPSADFSEVVGKAIAGDTAPLYRKLAVGSGLPGPRMNSTLAVAFAHDCVRYAPKVDPVIWKMAELSDEEARGATAEEFIVVCGVLGCAARSMTTPDVKLEKRVFTLLEGLADDTRFRVRDAVPIALAMLGTRKGISLLDDVEGWSDRYFHAAAVLRSFEHTDFIEKFGRDDYLAPMNFLQASFELARDAPRSDWRYPGHKALIEALREIPKTMEWRFGIIMFDRLKIWAETWEIPQMRELILDILEHPQIKEWKLDVVQIREMLKATDKPPRDPTKLIAGMRGRGKKAGRTGRRRDR